MQFLHDLRVAWRSLRKNPWLAITAVLTLGLGIGFVGVIFSVVQGVVLQPLPYTETDRIVMVWDRWVDFPKTWMTAEEFRYFRGEMSSFEEMGLFFTDGINLVIGDQEPERVKVGFITASMFDVLGVDPVLGRRFTWEENQIGQDLVVLLSYELWQRRFGGSPDVLGSTIEVRGAAREIVGVMPRGFQLPLDYSTGVSSEIWLNFLMDLSGPVAVPRGGGEERGFYGVARLAPGASVEQAAAEIEALAKGLTAEGIYPERWSYNPLVVALLDEILGTTRRALTVLMAAVWLVLAVACANVALLLLARGNQRRRELAVRTALGAGRGRLVRELLAEGLVLGVIGGAVAVVLAYGGLRWLAALAVASSVPRLEDVTMQSGGLLLILGVSLLSALVAGILPALYHSMVNPQEDLKEGGWSVALSTQRNRSQTALVIMEMALAMVLLVGAGLLTRSFWNLLQVDLGFRTANVLTMRVNPSSLTFQDAERAPLFYEGLLARIEQVSGVEKVGAARFLPLASALGDWRMQVEGYEPAPDERVAAAWQAITPGYFEVMGIPLRAGRTFTAADRSDSQPVLIVNEAMAERYWPGENPIGKRVQAGAREDSPWSSVVGVVGNVRHEGITGEIKDKWYLPLSQFHLSMGFTTPEMTLTVLTSMPPTELAEPLREAILSYDPKLPAWDVQSLEQLVERNVSQSRLTTILMVICSLLALMLALVGTYGVIRHSVSQRSSEIGLRMALGALPQSIVRTVIRTGLTVSLAGIAIGLVTTLVVTRFLADLVYGVKTWDLGTFTAAGVLLLAVTTVASYFPARQAGKTDPMTALRNE